MKKMIIYIAIFSIINLVGCHYRETLYPYDYKFDENIDMLITTKDTTYNIANDDYYYNNDTLFAKIIEPLDNTTYLKHHIGIPINSIKEIEVERTNILQTTLIIAPFILLFLVIATFPDYSWGK